MNPVQQDTEIRRTIEAVADPTRYAAGGSGARWRDAFEAGKSIQWEARADAWVRGTILIGRAV